MKTKSKTKKEEEEINEELNNLIISSNNQNNNININKNLKPFISLSSLSKCQNCNIEFNGEENLPILFKCNHFFCKKCIETFFYEKDIGIKCPIHGLIAKSLDELIILNKLIEDDLLQSNYNEDEKNQNYDINTNENKESENYNNNNFCNIHQSQKLTHYVEDTRELICAYCAFNK